MKEIDEIEQRVQDELRFIESMMTLTARECEIIRLSLISMVFRGQAMSRNRRKSVQALDNTQERKEQ